MVPVGAGTIDYRRSFPPWLGERPFDPKERLLPTQYRQDKEAPPAPPLLADQLESPGSNARWDSREVGETSGWPERKFDCSAPRATPGCANCLERRRDRAKADELYSEGVRRPRSNMRLRMPA